MLQLMNAEICERVTDSLVIGQFVEHEIEGVVFTDKVVRKTLYSVTVLHGKTNLTLPVEYLTLYKKEVDTMATEPTKRAPGRPKGSTKAAAPAHPAGVTAPPPAPPRRHEFEPPGYSGHTPPDNSTVPFVPPGSAPPAQPQPQPTQQPVSSPPIALPPSVAVSPSEGEETDEGQPQALAWFVEGLENALADFTDSLKVLAKAVYDQATEDAMVSAPEPAANRSQTCADCVHSNMPQGLCDFYKMVPPMNVICNAKEKCPTFEALPF